jgi:predicted RNA-binding protein with PIN domain
VLESLAIVAVFVVAGLAWAAVASQIEGRDESPRPAYSLPAMEESEASIWLVDGYNVLHAGVLGGRDRSQWWTASRRRELLERVAGFEQAAELWIVFDGPEDPGADLTQPGPRCVFALSADDWLVDRVRRSDDPSQIAVVTADRQVAGRARSRGAQIVSPAEFLSRCTS